MKDLSYYINLSDRLQKQLTKALDSSETLASENAALRAELATARTAARQVITLAADVIEQADKIRRQYSPPVPPTVVGEKQGSADADLRSPAASPVIGGQGAGE